MTTRAGEFIGEALANNPNYPIKRISFNNQRLEDYGINRLAEAANANANIEVLDLGIITDVGMNLLT